MIVFGLLSIVEKRGVLLRKTHGGCNGSNVKTARQPSLLLIGLDLKIRKKYVRREKREHFTKAKI